MVKNFTVLLIAGLLVVGQMGIVVAADEMGNSAATDAGFVDLGGSEAVPPPFGDGTLDEICEGNMGNPIAAALAKHFGASYDQVQGLFCDEGMGVGNIGLAFFSAFMTGDGTTVDQILTWQTMSGFNWINIWQRLGLIVNKQPDNNLNPMLNQYQEQETNQNQNQEQEQEQETNTPEPEQEAPISTPEPEQDQENDPNQGYPVD